MFEAIRASTTSPNPTEYFSIALDAIREIPGTETAPDQEALLFIEVGRMCDKSGEWEQGLHMYQRALEVCESSEIRAEALKQKANVESKLGERKAALGSYEASLEILESSGKLGEVGVIYNSIGFNLFEIGNLTEARRYYDKALKTADESHDIQLMADVESNLGILSNVMGQMDDAVKHYKQSIKGYVAVCDAYGLAQVYHNLGMTYTEKEEWKAAGECYQKSMELCIKHGDLDLLPVIYANSAKLALRLKKLQLAKLYCGNALSIFEKTGNKAGLAEVHRLYGMIYSSMQDWNAAEEYLYKAIEICEECDSLLTEAESYHELGSMNRERGRSEEALRNLQKAVDMYEALKIHQKVSRIKEEMQALTAQV
jgi:tetratricopeptide (TPR) repeat protein